jgi:hypothetical protein
MIRCPGCDHPVPAELIVCELCWELLPDGLKLEYAAVLLSDGDLDDMHDRIRRCVAARVSV